MKKALFAVLAFAVQILTAGAVMAQDAVAAPERSAGAVTGLALGACFAIGLAAFGGALGQGKAASAALEGIARNPGAAAKIQTPMIIALALIESLVIYALVIAFMLQGKI